MYLLELTPAEVSDSRFRQLKAKFEQINQQLHLCNFDLGDGRKFQKHIGFIPYKVWKNGKINWNALDEDAFALSENMHYKFT